MGKRAGVLECATLVWGALLAGWCPQNQENEEDEGPERTVTSAETLDEGPWAGLVVASGGTLTVDGPRLVVEGDLTIEEGAEIQALDEDKLEVVVTGDLDVLGSITSSGHVVLASEASLLPTDEELDEEETTSGVDVSGFTGQVPPVFWNVRGPIRAGRRGGKGGTVRLDVRGDLRIGAAPALPSLSFEVPDGDDGEDQEGCNVEGGKGGRGGKLRVQVRGGTLELENVTFEGGNGGSGGDAEGADCPDGSTNIGGEGGKSGTFRVVAQLASGMDVKGTVRFDGWSAGAGGDALIDGENGTGGPGASVTAEGGQGHEVDGYSLIVTSGINYEDDPSLEFDIGHGGEGGYAQASGGDGGDGVCDKNSGLASPSHPGGDGTAEAGDGGEVDVSVSVPDGAPIDVADSFRGGDGSDGDGYGGDGGDGVDCFRRGGDGGVGGDAVGVLGEGGESNQADDGDDGAELAEAGDGGAGGMGEEEGGDGGNGGDATAADDALGGDGGNGGMGYLQGGDGGNGGCPAGLGGAPGAGATPGAAGAACP